MSGKQVRVRVIVVVFYYFPLQKTDELLLLQCHYYYITRPSSNEPFHTFLFYRYLPDVNVYCIFSTNFSR